MSLNIQFPYVEIAAGPAGCRCRKHGRQLEFPMLDPARQAESPPLPAGHLRRRIEPDRAQSPRAPVAAHVGGGRDLQLQALRVRALLLHAEGRGCAGRLRDVPHEGTVAGLAAPGRDAGGGAGLPHALRGAGQVPADRRDHPPVRARRALRGVREAQGQARARGSLRSRAQAAAAPLSPRGRHRDLARGRRPA